MTYPRRAFGIFSLEVPPGLFEDDEAPFGYDAALTGYEAVTLRIRRMSPGSAAALADVLRLLCDTPPQPVTAAGAAHLWPGLAAREATGYRLRHYLFESQGQVIHGRIDVSDALWTDYGVFLEAALLSLDLGEAPAPTLPLFPGAPLPEIAARPAEEHPVDALKRRLANASGEIMALIGAARFEAAETLARSIDADIYGAVALAGAYEAALTAAPTDPALLERALYWAACALPSPQTAYEADEFSAALEAREARLRAIARS
jgi:hypothetical protein